MPNPKSPRNCGQKKFLNAIGALYTAFQARPYVLWHQFKIKRSMLVPVHVGLVLYLVKYISILIQIEYKNYKH